MKRREFITLLAGAAAAWPLAARAQQPAMPVIGFLNSASPDGFMPFIAAFRQGLKEAGLVEGQNVVIEYRWAEGRYDRLPALLTDLVQRKVTVIAATSTPAAQAAKVGTSTIPIVFTTGDDPIKLGLVASFNRPGGNVTGVSNMVAELGSKQIGLLRELATGATAITVLVNPKFPGTETQLRDVEAAARVLGLQLTVLRADSTREIDTAFATITQRGGGTLLVGTDPFFFAQRDHIVAQAARHAIPAIYPFREFAVAGGLIVMEATLRIRIAKPAYIPAELSGERNPLTCRCSGQPSSNSSSISRLRRLWVSQSPTRCNCWPTR